MLDLFMLSFSWLFIGILALSIIVPYLRGKSDLVTAKNMFLAGSMLFVGYAMVAALGSKHLAHGTGLYTQFTDADYLRYCLGAVVFYSVFLFTYNKMKFPRRLAGHALLKWPPASTAVVYFMLPITAIFVVTMLFPPNVPGLRQILLLMGIPVLAFAFTLSFVAWYKQPANPVLLLTMAAVAAAVLVLTVKVSYGRRPLVGVLLGPPIVLYWLRWRYRRPVVTLTTAALLGFGVLVVNGAYMQVRENWRTEHTLTHALESLKKMASKLVTPKVGAGNMLAQDTAECSLLAIHMYTEDITPRPFHSIVHVLVNPIPREFWPNKPVGLGKLLPDQGRDVYGLPGVAEGGSWGPGIIGHGYHEGGAVMLVFYGVLFAVALRLIDEILMRQSGNPYVLACFAAISGHVMGWSRGDIGNFAIQIIAACIMTLSVCWVGRLIYGTGLVYPRTSHLDITNRGFVTRCSLPAANVRTGSKRLARG